jgi:SAM-dependent methyltransferase
MSASEKWSASWASAGLDAMTVYDEILVPRMFVPWVDALLNEVGVAPGEAVLDVATGPGTVARPAAMRVGPSGRVTACDLSPAMLAVATAKPPLEGAAPITYLRCAAERLEVSDEAFDVVLCQQGLQFFPDRTQALTEMRRALKPGGRAGVSVWCDIEECPAFEALATGLGDVLGRETDLAYRNGPWGLTDPDELARLFAEAGFAEVRVTRRTVPIVFDGGPPQMVAALAVASVGPQVEALDEKGRKDLVAATARALEPLLHDGTVRSEMASHVVRATR